MDRDLYEFGLAPDQHGHGLAHVEADLGSYLLGVAHLVVIDGEYDVALPKAGLLGGGVIHDLNDLSQADGHVAGDHEADGEQNEGQGKVHGRAGAEDEQAGPGGLGRQAGGIAGVLLSQHAHEAPQGDEVDGVDCAVEFLAPYAGRVAQADFHHAHAGELGDDKVP